jgi:hypothetical protein
MNSSSSRKKSGTPAKKATSSSSRRQKDYDEVSEDSWVPKIKRRRRFSIEETRILETEYAKNSSPNQEKIQAIADRMSTPRKIVTTWFQNRRAKVKRREKVKRCQKAVNKRRSCRYDISHSTEEDDDEEEEYEEGYDDELDGIVYGGHNGNYEDFDTSHQETEYEDGNNIGDDDDDEVPFFDDPTVNQQLQEQMPTSDSHYDPNLYAVATALITTPAQLKPPPSYSCSTAALSSSSDEDQIDQQSYAATTTNTEPPQQNNQPYNINIYNNMSNFFHAPQDNFFFLPQPTHDQNGDDRGSTRNFFSINNQLPPAWFNVFNQQYPNEFPQLMNSSNCRPGTSSGMPFFMNSNNFTSSTSYYVGNSSNTSSEFTPPSCINPTDLFLNFHHPPHQHQHQFQYGIQEIVNDDEIIIKEVND